MAVYKRFVIPFGSANGGGKCLAEIMDKTVRITLAVRQKQRKPLDMWLFDDTNAYLYPKPLYADRNGNISLRQAIKDSGLSKVRCVCLLDNEREPQFVGFCGEKLDWRGILLNSAKPTEAAESNAENVSGEEFKQQVREMVEELDDKLKEMPVLSADIPDGMDWRDITLKQVAENKRLWKYARNPFVASHCGGEKPLIMAENEKFYFLGVPCDKKDRFVGCSQGFRIFTDRGGGDYCILKCEK